MSLLPYLLCIVILGAILICREVQHMKLEKALLDRIMVQNDLEPLPAMTVVPTFSDEEPVDVKKKLEQALRSLDKQKHKEKIVFRIPGMPSGMGDIAARGTK